MSSEKTIDLLQLTLNPEKVSKLEIILSAWFKDSPSTAKYSSILSAYKEVFSSRVFLQHPLTALSALIRAANGSIAMANRGDNGHPCRVSRPISKVSVIILFTLRLAKN